MIITYIDHSGFLLETEDVYFLFDYYRGDIPKMSPDKEVVVFVSHRHGDHYNPEIFHLFTGHPKIQYVLSKDVPVKKLLCQYEEQRVWLENVVTIVGKNETQELMLSNGRTLQITTLKSTDEGVAYLLCYEGKTYYHAGDLNLWVWEGETKQYNNNMAANYFRELDKLRNRDIDVAFVPLDPRQEKDAFGGLESFMEYTDSKKVFPMHFWGEFDIIKAFLKKHPEYAEQIMVIGHKGQRFQFDEKHEGMGRI